MTEYNLEIVNFFIEIFFLMKMPLNSLVGLGVWNKIHVKIEY